MSSNENEALLHRYIKEVWDKRNPAAVDQFLAPNYRRHRSPNAEPLTREGQKELLTRFRAAFPDVEITVEETIAEGDRIAFRSTMRGTHRGSFLGVAPTGRQVTVGLVDVIHVENGKFVEQWGGPDLLDLLQQLGADISVVAQYSVKFVELSNGVKLPYVEQGDPLGVPLLLVHGYAGSWRDFEPLLPYLPASIHAFAMTQRGHGDASRPAAGYRPQDFAADLAAFMDALHLEAAVLAGGSSGGFAVRRIAIDHPERVLGLVLLGSPADLRGNAGVQRLWDENVSKLTDPVDPAFVREFIESTVDRPVPPALVETMVQDSLKVPAHVWRAALKGLLEEDSYSELGKIVAPTLIVWGDQDVFLTRPDQEAFAAQIEGSRLLVYPGGGHVFYWEEPDRVASDLVAFVKELGKR